MSKYSVIILPKAIHGLSGIDKHVAKRITDKLTWLSENVGSINTLPLTGELSGLFKLKIGKFLEDVLGYDMFSDISKEYTVKCKYVDYAVKVGNKLVFL